MRPKLRKVFKESLLESEKLGIYGKEQDDYIMSDIIRAKNGDFSKREIKKEDFESENLNEGYVSQPVTLLEEFPELKISGLVSEEIEFKEPEPVEKEENVSRKPGRKKKV